MERHEVLEMMAALTLAGMRAAFDELVADGLKLGHPVQRIVGDLLEAEIADKRARSVKYQMSVARLPLAKELADFDFAGILVNEPLARVTDFERRQMAAVRKELDQEYEARNGLETKPSAGARQTKLSSTSQT